MYFFHSTFFEIVSLKFHASSELCEFISSEFSGVHTIQYSVNWTRYFTKGCKIRFCKKWHLPDIYSDSQPSIAASQNQISPGDENVKEFLPEAKNVQISLRGRKRSPKIRSDNPAGTLVSNYQWFSKLFCEHSVKPSSSNENQLYDVNPSLYIHTYIYLIYLYILMYYVYI